MRVDEVDHGALSASGARHDLAGRILTGAFNQGLTEQVDRRLRFRSVDLLHERGEVVGGEFACRIISHGASSWWMAPIEQLPCQTDKIALYQLFMRIPPVAGELAGCGFSQVAQVRFRTLR